MSYPLNMWISAAKMLLALAAVLATIWMLYRWTRGTLLKNGAGASHHLIRPLASHYLGVKKSITMVQVPGTVLVLGISADRMQLLTTIDDPALVQQIQGNAGNNDQDGGFRKNLQRLMANGKWSTTANVVPSDRKADRQ